MTRPGAWSPLPPDLEAALANRRGVDPVVAEARALVPAVREFAPEAAAPRDWLDAAVDFASKNAMTLADAQHAKPVERRAAQAQVAKARAALAKELSAQGLARFRSGFHEYIGGLSGAERSEAATSSWLAALPPDRRRVAEEVLGEWADASEYGVPVAYDDGQALVDEVEAISWADDDEADDGATDDSEGEWDQ